MSEPDLLKQPSKQIVCLYADAKNAIAERMHEFRLEAADYEHECGGFLLGYDIESITVATQGRNATPLRPRETMLDYAEADRTAEAFGLDVVGSWHSHPDAHLFSWRPDPSQADLEHWAGLLGRFDRNMAVGVIASTPHRMHGWIVFRDGNGNAICKPCPVIW
jgi:proteasome lid subunit RPN8/RPN11